jgi:GTPase Era involved in 16S rRNA processing
LLNTLIGQEKFAVSPLHGETKKSAMERWSEIEAAGVFLIDTPGLDEAGGEIREDMAKEVANRPEQDRSLYQTGTRIPAAVDPRENDRPRPSG